MEISTLEAIHHAKVYARKLPKNMVDDRFTYGSITVTPHELLNGKYDRRLEEYYYRGFVLPEEGGIQKLCYDIIMNCIFSFKRDEVSYINVIPMEHHDIITRRRLEISECSTASSEAPLYSNTSF